MKLGLVADIHEAVEPLRLALARFRQERVDQVVVLGDVFDMGLRIEETCALLAEAGAIGVWGHHDFGLCGEPAPEVRARYSSRVLNFMGSLQPKLEIERCLFTHVEPWLDPQRLEELWYFDGPLNTPAKVNRIFEALPQRLLFAGHYHGWLLATPAGMEAWHGQRDIRFAEGQRYFVVVGALCHGCYALLDTITQELVPLSAADS